MMRGRKMGKTSTVRGRKDRETSTRKGRRRGGR
jgi:hypothetical protein